MDDQQSSQSYNSARQELQQLLGDWEAKEKPVTLKRRELRRFDVDVQEKRQKKEIGADETFIPIRSIDQSIKQEKPQQIAFVDRGRRLLIFKDIEDPGSSTEDLEIAFTDYMRYPGWTHVWHRAFDSTDLHGGAFIEVLLDTSKPLHSRLEFIAREALIFPLKARSIQSCEMIMRMYEYMPHELEGFVGEWGFNKEQVDKLVKDKEKRRHEPIVIYKVFMRRKGVVHVAWYEPSCDDWLLEPRPLNLGIYDLEEAVAFQLSPPDSPPPAALPVKDFPIFFLPYELTEDEVIVNVKGRAHKDVHAQEALTNLWTNVINATTRASSVYGSTENHPSIEPGTGKELIPIKGNTIVDRQINYWAFPWPDPFILSVAQALNIEKQQESGRVDFAAQNRKDSRKTAREIEAASSQASLMSSVNLSAQSLTILNTYELTWMIGQSQIAIGAIKNFPIEIQRIVRKYKLTTAGDVDVAQREEQKGLIRETYPAIAGTPLGTEFLKFMIETFFPTKAKEWQAILEQQDPALIIQALMGLVASSVPEGLDPAQQEKVQQILQMAQQYVNARQPANSSQGVAGQSVQPPTGQETEG